MSKETCPTCGSDVKIVSSGSTHHYEPDNKLEALVKMMAEAIDKTLTCGEDDSHTDLNIALDAYRKAIE